MTLSSFGQGDVADISQRRMVWAHYVPWYTPNNRSQFPGSFYNFPDGSVYPNPFEREIRAAQEMGIDGFFVDMVCYDRGMAFGNLRPYLAAAHGTDFKFAITLDRRNDPDKMIAELVRMLSDYGDHPNYARVQNRYVVNAYTFFARPPEEWRRIREGCDSAGRPLYLVANMEKNIRQPIESRILAPYAGLAECVYYFSLTGKAGLSSEQENANGVAFCLAHSAEFMPCLHPGYYGAWLCDSNDFYQPFRGFDRLYEGFVLAERLKKSSKWLHLTTWNDYRETALEPCRLTSGNMQLVKAMSTAWKGKPLSERAEILFAYHREEIPGTMLRIESLRLPSLEAGAVTVRGCLRGSAGQMLLKLPAKALKEGWDRCEWKVPTQGLCLSAFVRPEITVLQCGRQATRSLPPIFLKMPWLENAVTTRIAFSERSSIDSDLSVRVDDSVPSAVTAKLVLRSDKFVSRAILYRNDRPVGQFRRTPDMEPSLTVRCHFKGSGGLFVTNGCLEQVVRSEETALHGGRDLRLVPNGFVSRCTPSYKLLSARLRGGPDMRLTWSSDNMRCSQKIGVEELLSSRIAPTKRGFGDLIVSPDMTLFEDEGLNAKTGKFLLRAYVGTMAETDLWWVEYLLADGTRGESEIVTTTGRMPAAERRQMLETGVTLETASGASGRTDRHEWLDENGVDQRPTVVDSLVSPCCRRCLAWSFEDSGAERFADRHLKIDATHFGSGWRGRGLVFTGERSEVVSLPKRVSPLGAFEMRFALRPAAPDIRRCVIGKVGWGEGVEVFLDETGRLEVVWSAGVEPDRKNCRLKSDRPLPTDRWTAARIVSSCRQIRLDLDGQTDAECDKPLVRVYGNATLRLGGDPDGGCAGYVGGLDELEIE